MLNAGYLKLVFTVSTEVEYFLCLCSASKARALRKVPALHVNSLLAIRGVRIFENFEYYSNIKYIFIFASQTMY